MAQTSLVKCLACYLTCCQPRDLWLSWGKASLSQAQPCPGEGQCLWRSLQAHGHIQPPLWIVLPSSVSVLVLGTLGSGSCFVLLFITFTSCLLLREYLPMAQSSESVQWRVSSLLSLSHLVPLPRHERMEPVRVGACVSRHGHTYVHTFSSLTAPCFQNPGQHILYASFS